MLAANEKHVNRVSVAEVRMLRRMSGKSRKDRFRMNPLVGT